MKPAESAVRVLKWVTPVSLVEISVVHWLLPWAWARYVLGLYGAVWLLGFYQTFRRRSPGAARWTAPSSMSAATTRQNWWPM